MLFSSSGELLFIFISIVFVGGKHDNDFLPKNLQITGRLECTQGIFMWSKNEIGMAEKDRDEYIKVVLGFKVKLFKCKKEESQIKKEKKEKSV